MQLSMLLLIMSVDPKAIKGMSHVRIPYKCWLEQGNVKVPWSISYIL